MRDLVVIEYAGIRFRSTGYTVVQGDRTFGIVRDGLQGFDAPAARRGEDVPRPGVDGAFALPSFSSAAIRSISGVAVAGSAREVQRMRDDLFGAGADGGLHRLVYTVLGEPRWCMAQVWDQPVWSWDPRTPLVARFQIMLRSPRPGWSGNVEAFDVPAAGSVQVVQRGNTDSRPVFIRSGATPAGWWVECGGNRLTVNAAIPSGRTATVDSLTGRVRLDNGVELSGVAGREPVARAGVSTARASHATKIQVTDTYR